MSEQSIPARQGEQVEYRDVPGWPGRRVGDDGSVWSCLIRGVKNGRRGSWRRMATRLNTHGYPCVNFCRGRAIQRTYSVHALVLLTFVGPLPPGMETRHLNGVRTDNRLANLVYGTPVENCADAQRHGTHRRGEQVASSKLTEPLVRAIRAEYAAGGVTQSQLGRKYGITQPKIGAVILRRTWAHVED